MSLPLLTLPLSLLITDWQYRPFWLPVGLPIVPYHRLSVGASPCQPGRVGVLFCKLLFIPQSLLERAHTDHPRLHKALANPPI